VLGPPLPFFPIGQELCYFTQDKRPRAPPFFVLKGNRSNPPLLFPCERLTRLPAVVNVPSSSPTPHAWIRLPQTSLPLGKPLECVFTPRVCAFFWEIHEDVEPDCRDRCQQVRFPSCQHPFSTLFLPSSDRHPFYERAFRSTPSLSFEMSASSAHRRVLKVKGGGRFRERQNLPRILSRTVVHSSSRHLTVDFFFRSTIVGPCLPL